jgi:hemoglobin-like flavoprotein
VSPDEIHLIRTSFDKLWSVSRTVTGLFYERLFELEPEAQALFRGDLDEQKLKLMGMIAAIVGALDRSELFDMLVTNLGRRHAAYGVKAQHYGPVGEALLFSLEQGLGPAFTPATRAAWAALYAEVRDGMLRESRAA